MQRTTVLPGFVQSAGVKAMPAAEPRVLNEARPVVALSNNSRTELDLLDLDSRRIGSMSGCRGCSPSGG